MRIVAASLLLLVSGCDELKELEGSLDLHDRIVDLAVPPPPSDLAVPPGSDLATPPSGAIDSIVLSPPVPSSRELGWLGWWPLTRSL